MLRGYRHWRSLSLRAHGHGDAFAVWLFRDSHVVGPDTFNRLFTMHGTTMVFLVGMPFVAGLSNY